jgi:hypothetical protein
VVGVWTGTYTCNQGLSGVRLTITGAGGDTVRATAEFCAVPSNPGVPDGSYVLTGNYSASGGLVLIVQTRCLTGGARQYSPYAICPTFRSSG